MLQNTQKVLFSIALTSFLLPLSVFAAKPVSQHFAWDFSYFPMQDDQGALIFSNGSFYSSENPSLAQVWTSVTTDTTYSQFSPLVAESFHGYTYAITGTEKTVGNSLDFEPTHIVRINQEKQNALHTVFSLPESTTEALSQLRDMVSFKDRLYVSDSEGNLWRTKKGKTWHKLETLGLPTTADCIDLYATPHVLYCVSENVVYVSKGGLRWTEIQGEYQNYTRGGTVSIARFNKRLYIYTYTTDDHKARVWERQGDGSMKQVFESSNTNHFALFAGSARLYLTEYQEAEGAFVVRTLEDGVFVESKTGLGLIQGMIENHGKVLFVVTDDTGTFLWRYGKVD